MSRSLVSLLAESANALTGEGTPLPAAARAAANRELAADLRRFAALLCDHPRTAPDGRCRYCDAPLTTEPS